MNVSNLIPLQIKAYGHGRRRRCQPDAFGFPRAHAKRAKEFLGWRTGDMARADIPKGKYAGHLVGRVVIRHSPSFQIGVVSVHPKYLTKLQMADGYDYVPPCASPRRQSQVKIAGSKFRRSA